MEKKLTDIVKFPLENSGTHWVFDANNAFVFKFVDKTITVEQRKKFVEFINNPENISDEENLRSHSFSHHDNLIYKGSMPFIEINIHYKSQSYQHNLTSEDADNLRSEFANLIISRISNDQ